MRIKVDFSDFFDDQRKLSVVNVNKEETKTVRDVLYKIILMFKLTPAAQKRRSSIDDVSKEKLELGLFEEGFYIPPEETSTVLQDIGILKLKAVASTGEDDGEGKKRKRKRQKVEDEVEQDEEIKEDEIIPRKGRSKRNKYELENNAKDRKGHQRRDSVETEEEVEEEEDDARKRKFLRKRKDREETEGEENDIVKVGQRKKMTLSTGKTTVTKACQRRNSLETDDEGEDTRDRKTCRRREDSKETDEEDERNDGKKKGRRKREFLKYDKFEEGKVHRQKKGYQKKHHLQTEVDEDEIIENELGKRGKMQRSKKSKSSDDVTHNVSDDEQKMKKHKRKERYLLEVENQEEEEIKSKKRNRREQIKVIISQVKPEEIDNMPHKDQKQEKKNKSMQAEEAKVAESLTKKSSNKSAKLFELKRLRSTRQILKEQNEAEPSSTDEQQGKRFQEKEISTSSVIHVESNEEYESSSSCCGDRKDNCGKNLEADSALVSSVTGEPYNPRVKRKRKHNKGKKSQRHNINEEISGTLQGHCGTSQLQDRQLKNSNVSTSSQRSHVLFNTDDEEEVSSVSTFDQGNDIEIVGTSSGLNRRHCRKEDAHLVDRAFSDEVNHRLLLNAVHGEHFKSSTPKFKSKPPVIEIEGDDASALIPTSSDMPVITTNSVTRTFSQNKTVNEDCFATLRQMVAKKTITVVSISSSTCTVQTQPLKLPEVVPAMKRGPPHPVFIDKTTLSEETRNTFYDLLKLKNQIVPLVLRTPREAILNAVCDLEVSDSDSSEAQNDVDICEVESCVAGTDCKSAQTFSLVSEKVSQQDDTKDSCEVLSIPSTSGYKGNVEVLVDKPGAAAKSCRRSVPRPFQAVGSLLLNLRNPENSQKSTELQKETNNDIEVEAVHSSPDQEDKRDITEVATKTDAEVTSTQGDARPPEEVLDEEWHDLPEKGETSGSSLEKPSSLTSTPFPVSLDIEETQQLMEEMLTETLKQDIAKDIKAATCERDSRFQSHPVMKTLPKIGEYVAIKVLSLDEKLRPIYSPYIAVKVLNVDGLLVTLKIVDEKKSKEEQTVTDEDGVEQVDLTFEEEVDLTHNEQEEILELDWRDIYQPRLLFP